VAWWARRELREAEEQCCDAWVLWALPKTKRAYASALLAAVDFLSGVRPAVPLGASGMSEVHHLRRRLVMIRRGEVPRVLSWSGSLAVWGLASVLLPLGPAWSQDAPGAVPPPAAPRIEPPAAEPQPPPEPAPPGLSVGTGPDDEPAATALPPQADEAVSKAIQDARAEIRRLEQQLDRARRRLDRLQGGSPPGARGRGPVSEAVAPRPEEPPALPATTPPPRARAYPPSGEPPAYPGRPSLPRSPAHARPVPPLPPAAPAAPEGELPRVSTVPVPPSVSVGAPTSPALATPPSEPNLPRPVLTPSPAPTPRPAQTRSRLSPRVSAPDDDQERRLQEVEKKLDRLLDELRELRRERAPGQPATSPVPATRPF
jgi:hypothetical protein